MFLKINYDQRNNLTSYDLHFRHLSSNGSHLIRHSLNRRNYVSS